VQRPIRWTLSSHAAGVKPRGGEGAVVSAATPPVELRGGVHMLCGGAGSAESEGEEVGLVGEGADNARARGAEGEAGPSTQEAEAPTVRRWLVNPPAASCAVQKPTDT
jgi:hypothetical protein